MVMRQHPTSALTRRSQPWPDGPSRFGRRCRWFPAVRSGDRGDGEDAHDRHPRRPCDVGVAGNAPDFARSVFIFAAMKAPAMWRAVRWRAVS
jgi:hypothetical protein